MVGLSELVEEHASAESEATAKNTLQSRSSCAGSARQTGFEVRIVKKSPLPRSFALNSPAIQACLTAGVRTITARWSHTPRLRAFAFT
jgi:hypothetical protein